MKLLKVCCIIPSLCSKNVYPSLKKSITSLTTSAQKAKIEIKIIIVTNGNELYLKGITNKIAKLIKYHSKFSFAGMNNLAIETSLNKFQTDWILLINDDAYIESNFFIEFKNSLEKKKFDILVPLVYEADSILIDSFGIEYLTSGHAKNSHTLTDHTQLAAAACLLVNSTFLKKIKKNYTFYFNEILNSYFEDVEFSIRARGIGGKIHKSIKMVAHHLVSQSSGKKSYFVMYQTFRNIIWVIILTWPLKSMFKKIISISVIQSFIIFYSMFHYGPLMYIKILVDTLQNLHTLHRLRHRIINSYKPNFKFESIFSKYAFRSYSKIKIRL